ncbi:MAG: single-stranded-DNA-specific exonuclease RecJ [Candidatus Moranbacteria bacterium]|nr:single-stranded-DNA-specific exonuclease RecJ [Candidatus Moranbacteria bacterium]
MKWILKPSPEIPGELQSVSLNPITLQLLVQRGFFSKVDIQKFLNSSYDDLHSPDGLAGVKEAVDRLAKAIKKKEKVAIYGDYDADGITSTVLLKEVLEKVGLSAETYIPDRNKEGYGLNEKALDMIKADYGADLLITVDCGISNKDEIEYARKKGMGVIVIDHHSIPKALPQNCILINPKLPGQEYPFKDLAGVGVVFKFAQALWKKIIPEKEAHLKWFLDLVAIGTVADCVPLIDENRIFAKFGLIVLQKTKRLGIQEIIKTARLNIDEKNPPSVENIGYQIGPRFNAAGRMDHADLTLNLLTGKDPVKARILALELESMNSARQKITQQVLGEIKSTLEPGKDYRLIIRKGAHWPMGILGVVAGKIADEYYCPVFILRENKDLIEGSGRSIEAFDLISAVSRLDDLVEKYGGHSQAMGLKIKPENLPKFEKRLEKLIKDVYNEEAWGKAIHVDAEIATEKIDWDLFSETRKLEPFGEGNREPVFLSHNLLVREMNLVGNGQKHIKFSFSLDKDKKIIEGIFFKGAEIFSQMKKGETISAVYNLKSNKWNGSQKLELNIIDIHNKQYG